MDHLSGESRCSNLRGVGLLKKILLVNSGSLGDLHPFIGLAQEFMRRGTEVLLVSSESYRPYIESFGIPFASIRPDVPTDDPEILAAVMDPLWGPRRLHKDFIFKHTRPAYEDLKLLSEGFDVVVTGALGFFVPTLAEVRKIPWVTVFLSPILLWSAYDPPIIPQAPILSRLCRRLGPNFTKLFFDLMFKGANSWANELHRLRRELGLGASPGLYRGMMDSPFLNVMLFSKHFAPSQSDWPRPFVQPGFVGFDGKRVEGLEAELSRFFDAGEAPVLFTLGSTASEKPGQLLEVFHKASALIAQRSLFVVGKKVAQQFRHLNSDRVFYADYVPYSEVMSRAKVVVHQGGVGTTAQAMKSGRPSLVVAEVNDQPDNGRHLERTGAGDWVHVSGLSGEALAQKISLLANEDSSYAVSAKNVAAALRTEDAAAEACTKILALLEP